MHTLATSLRIKHDVLNLINKVIEGLKRHLTNPSYWIVCLVRNKLVDLAETTTLSRSYLHTHQNNITNRLHSYSPTHQNEFQKDVSTPFTKLNSVGNRAT